MRHHGDFHLGQVLLTKNDFLITDFEGEPGRTFEQRRVKHSPLRDVAGMLRSFSYAKWSARARAESKDSAALDAWEDDVRRAFLAAYAEATKGSGLYASFDDVKGLLQLFELEKVLYELRYEINNRPNWIHVPLAGLLGMLGGDAWTV
jgi:maltose alpha-D-glucosyltransferase/alpha-amylase